MLAITEQGRPRGGQAATLVLGRHVRGPGKSAEAERTGKGHGQESRRSERRRALAVPAGASEPGTGHSSISLVWVASST